MCENLLILICDTLTCLHYWVPKLTENKRILYSQRIPFSPEKTPPKKPKPTTRKKTQNQQNLNYLILNNLTSMLQPFWKSTQLLVYRYSPHLKLLRLKVIEFGTVMWTNITWLNCTLFSTNLSVSLSSSTTAILIFLRMTDKTSNKRWTKKKV